MNEFVLLDGAIWRHLQQFDALMHRANALPLYADLPSAHASQLGPWLLDADAFRACLPGNEPRALPWRCGFSYLATDESRTGLAVHLESQRVIAMAEGDLYYLRYADTRALDALSRVLSPEQMQQLKGPVVRWDYLDRFGGEREFGAGVPADPSRHAAIVLSGEQSARMLEQQLAADLADYLETGREDPTRCSLSADLYAQIEAAAAFVLLHGIEPLAVQRHIAAIAVEAGGAVFADAGFVARIESLRVSGRWHELMMWRAVSIT